MNTKNVFEPKVIGLPDTKKEKAIIDFYTKVCDDANGIYWKIEEYLDAFDEIPLHLFFSFLNAKDPREFLYIAWMQRNKVEIPMGLSIEKAIELDLIDVPRSDFNLLIEERNDLVRLVESSKNELKFFFPIRKLFDERPDYRGFKITALGFPDGFESTEFDLALYNHIRVFTKSETENYILEKINKFVDLMNELTEVGIIFRSKGGWEKYLETNLVNNLVFSESEEKPFSINKNVTRRLVLRKGLVSSERVFEKNLSGFVTSYGSFNDILSFVAEDLPAVKPSET